MSYAPGDGPPAPPAAPIARGGLARRGGLGGFLRRVPRTQLLLALCCFALYLPGFWWGAPHATAYEQTRSWAVDDETPLGPLSEVHNILHPKPDQNLGYPLLWYFIVAAAYAPYMAYLFLTGRAGPPSADFPFGLVDPVGTLATLSAIAHFIAVLMGVGIVLAAFEAARVLWDRRTAVLAALFAAFAFPMFYYSRTANVDVPVLFFTALALAVYARVLVSGLTMRRALWLGVWIGCAAAVKEPSAASFLALPAVVLVAAWRASGGGWRTWRFWRLPLAAGLAAFLAYGAGSGLFVDPGRWVRHVQFMSGRVSEAAAGEVAFFSAYPNTRAGHLALLRLFGQHLASSLTLPGLLLAAIGVVWTLARERRAWLWLLPALTYAVVLFFAVRGAYLRYLMPVTFTLAFFAARAVACGLASRARPVRLGWALTAAVALGLALLRGLDLTHAMLTDTRYAAAAWLAARAEPGDRIEYFGPPNKLPALEAGVVARRTLAFHGAAFRPRLDNVAAEEARVGWAQRRPSFILVLPDHSTRDGSPYSGTMPPLLYDDLLRGRLGYRLAAAFVERPLLPWVRRPALDYPMVSPPVRIFVPAGMPRVPPLVVDGLDSSTTR